MNLFKKIFGNNKNEKDSEKSKKTENPFMPEPNISDEEKFITKFRDNGGKFLYCENINELHQNFQNILLENKWNKDLFLVSSDNLKSIFNISDRKNPSQNSNYVCFLSECEFLIAFDGSLLFSSNQLAEKKIHQFPEHFVIFAKTSQIIKTISEGMTKIKQIYKNRIPSNITTIKNFKPGAEENFLSYGSSQKNLYLLLLEDS